MDDAVLISAKSNPMQLSQTGTKSSIKPKNNTTENKMEFKFDDKSRQPQIFLDWAMI